MTIVKTKPNLKVLPKTPEPEPEPMSLNDPRFKWTRGADVMKTWRKYGFVPPTETKFRHIYDDSDPNSKG